MTKGISGKTRVCGIIGDPIEHTMSPAMHNAAFAETGLDYVYVPFTVKPDRLEEAVAGLRAFSVVGFNVTIPHKITIIPLLDRLDPTAEKIGAVNTVVNENGSLAGYNTDASGFLRALLEKGIEPAGKNIVILGAGGAARAVSFILGERKANLIILNRTSGMERAASLAATIAGSTGSRAEAMELTDDNLEISLKQADILVNTTSVGMTPDTEASPVPAELLKATMVVYDIVYNPVMTRLLRDAEAAGAAIITGIDMLVRQGATAFEKWTGVAAPVETMKQAVANLLSRED